MTLGEALPREVRFRVLRVPELERVVAESSLLLLEHDPEVVGEASPIRDELVEHGARHLENLDAALATGNPAILEDYLAWASRYLVARGLPIRSLRDHVLILVQAILPDQDADMQARIHSLLERPGLIPSVRVPESSYSQDEDLMQAANELLDALTHGDRDRAIAVMETCFSSRMKLLDVYMGIVQPVMHAVGQLWEENIITWQEERTATATLPSVMAFCRGQMQAPPSTSRGSVVLTGVERELHEVGLQVLSDLLSANGWRVRNLGPNNPPDAVVGTLLYERPIAVGISVTMGRNLPEAQSLIEAIQVEPRLRDCAVIVGGTAFEPLDEGWRTLGADMYAPDAGALLMILDELSPRSRQKAVRRDER